MYGYDQMYIHLNPDFNSMYGYPLSMFTAELIMNYSRCGNIGYILMVNVNYPLYLQLLRRDLPFFK